MPEKTISISKPKRITLDIWCHSCAAGDRTVFTGALRLIDANMNKVVNRHKTMNARMLRRAENLSTIAVHERVKRYIDFPSIALPRPGDAIVL